nr:hypothetical protein 31 [bacterium]
MGYGTKKSSPKGKGKGGKKNKVCVSHETYGGKGRPATPVEIAAFGI